MKIPSWDIPKKILQNRINYVKFANTSLTTVEYCDISRAEKTSLLVIPNVEDKNQRNMYWMKYWKRNSLCCRNLQRHYCPDGPQANSAAVVEQKPLSAQPLPSHPDCWRSSAQTSMSASISIRIPTTALASLHPVQTVECHQDYHEHHHQSQNVNQHQPTSHSD